MTRIVIDPDELTGAASTLRTCAGTTAEIASGLRQCVNCPMPPDFAAQLDQGIRTADSILTNVVHEILAHVQELVNRASIAANDNGAATVDLTDLASMGSTVGGSSVGGGLVGGSTFSSGIPTLGGGPMILGGTSVMSGVPTLGGGSMTIGGTSVMSGIPTLGGGSMTIGGGTPVDPITQAIQNRIERVEREFGPMAANQLNNTAVTSALGTSRSGHFARTGEMVTSSELVRIYGPYAVV